MPLSNFEIRKLETDHQNREANIRMMTNHASERRSRTNQLFTPTEAQKAKEEGDRIQKEAWIQMMQRRERRLP